MIFITDRTQADIDKVVLFNGLYSALNTAEKAEWASGMKGAMSVPDWNRVETNSATIASELNAIGCNVQVETRSWVAGDFPTPRRINRIRYNLNRVSQEYRDVIGIAGFRESEKLHYAEVNDWERVLQITHELAQHHALQAKAYSGQIYSGQGVI